MQDQFEWKSVSTSKQEHRFFERFLNNDLEKMSVDLQGFYNKIESATLAGVSPVADNEAWKESNSVSTMKWREYNVFQFYTEEIYNVYKSVSEMVKEACEYYEINFDDQKFVIQGWFNINHKKAGKLNWHEHGPDGAPLFHGYYCISAEPSETHYITSAGPKVNVNLNNRAVLSEMGHPHAMADWDWDGPRITLAYDVMPLSTIENNPNAKEQHWFPLN
jgi:hypothetical protein